MDSDCMRTLRIKFHGQCLGGILSDWGRCVYNFWGVFVYGRVAIAFSLGGRIQTMTRRTVRYCLSVCLFVCFSTGQRRCQ